MMVTQVNSQQDGLQNTGSGVLSAVLPCHYSIMLSKQTEKQCLLPTPDGTGQLRSGWWAGVLHLSIAGLLGI